ncbi:hypothetical protein [Methanosarcina mazei]|nr:hypothetical protein [Methanosarcina mazei]
MRDDPSGESLDSWIIRLRREFHKYPELSFKEYETQKRILKILGELGIEGRKIADTGVLAVPALPSGRILTDSRYRKSLRKETGNIFPEPRE